MSCTLACHRPHWHTSCTCMWFSVWAVSRTVSDETLIMAYYQEIQRIHQSNPNTVRNSDRETSFQNEARNSCSETPIQHEVRNSCSDTPIHNEVRNSCSETPIFQHEVRNSCSETAIHNEVHWVECTLVYIVNWNRTAAFTRLWMIVRKFHSHQLPPTKSYIFKQVRFHK